MSTKPQATRKRDYDDGIRHGMAYGALWATASIWLVLSFCAFAMGV